MLQKKRLTLFLAISFGISWAIALIIFLTGGLANSPTLGSSGLTLAYALLIAYMWGPALGNMLTRLITREGFGNLWMAPEIKKHWQTWLMAWLAPGILIILGAGLFFLLFPQYFDSTFQSIRLQIAFSGQDPNAVDIPQMLLLQSALALAIAPLLNGIATFGEEFGWRAYLLPKLSELGVKKALIVSSIIWGIWHWPIIAMGYNYGSGYPGAPWSGLLLMVWTTLGFGVLIGWLTLRGRSVWPAVIAHGAINGMAAISTLVTKGEPSTLLGPTPVGVIALLPFTAVSLWILLAPQALTGIELKQSEN